MMIQLFRLHERNECDKRPRDWVFTVPQAMSCGFSDKQVAMLRNRTIVQSLCRLVQSGKLAGQEASYFPT
jgi:hypothetical protein